MDPITPEPPPSWPLKAAFFLLLAVFLSGLTEAHPCFWGPFDWTDSLLNGGGMMLLPFVPDRIYLILVGTAVQLAFPFGAWWILRSQGGVVADGALF